MLKICILKCYSIVLRWSVELIPGTERFKGYCFNGIYSEGSKHSKSCDTSLEMTWQKKNCECYFSSKLIFYYLSFFNNLCIFLSASVSLKLKFFIILLSGYRVCREAFFVSKRPLHEFVRVLSPEGSAFKFAETIFLDRIGAEFSHMCKVYPIAIVPYLIKNLHATKTKLRWKLCAKVP